MPLTSLRRTATHFKFAAALALLLLGLAQPSFAQNPIALPNTITTVAGGATGGGSAITGGVLPAKGAACSTGSPYMAADSLGDGCPGLNTVFSSDFRGGLQVDGAGNVFIMDTTNSLVRRIDARTGIVTAVTGTSTTGCPTYVPTAPVAPSSTDSYGDGCPFAQTKLSTARGIWVDPYGNVLIAGYGMDVINVLCNAVSPLCPNTTGHKQVGSMYRIAGCVASATATGTTGTGTAAGNTGDGYAASPYGNLAADVADWGTGSTAYGSCTAAATTTIAAVDSPRGVAADRYGNVYIAETGASGAGYRYRVVVGPPTFTLPGGTVLTNPLASILALDPAYSTLTPSTAYGRIYTILGGFTSATTGVTPPTTIGAACAGASGGSTLDTIGDGCPYYESTSATGQQGVGVDANGNVIFADNSEAIVRVLFLEPSVAAGTTTTSKMANAIRAANANTSLAITQGYVYPIIGAVNSAAANKALAAAPTLGTTTSGIPAGITKVALDSTGNIYISDFSNNDVLFFDINTGYVRQLLKSGAVCSAKLNSVGDGCPANASNFGGGSAGMGIGLSPEGDLYLADDTNLLIRKIVASNLIPLTKGTSLTQTEVIHAAKGVTGLTATLLGNSAEITATAATCPAANADGTLDCTVPVTFVPAEPNQRSTSQAVTTTGVVTSSVLPVAGIATAAALVTDSAAPTTTTVGTVTSATALAVDGQDNVFLVDTGASAFKEISNTGTTSTIAGTTPSTPYQLSVDPQGNVFVTNAGSSSFIRLTPGTSGTYTQSTLTFIPTQSTPGATATTPSIYGIAADHQGNLFLADRTNEAVYEIPAANLQATASSSNLNPVVKVTSGFTQLGELALDGQGNLFIADPGANTVFRLLAGTSTATKFASNVNPTHIATDAAGDLFVEDTAAKTVTGYPTSGLASTTVYTSATTPTGLAIASSGAAFVSLSGATALTQIQRNAATLAFGTTNGTANYLTGQLTNAGNAATTGTAITAASGSKFIFDSAGTSTCGTIPSTSNTQLAGAACTFTVYFNPATSGTAVSASLTDLPGTSAGVLNLTGTEPSGTTFPTTTKVTGPSSATFVATGTVATFGVTVSATGTTDVPTGTVTATIDCNSGSGTYTLSNGAVSIPVSGCTAGSHTLSVSYPNTGDTNTANASFGNSMGSATVVINQAPTTIAWTPTTTTRQYSAAVGLGVLNASATSNSAAVAGTFVYSAKNSSGSSVFIHSASFLPIGTYTLTGTFYPTDSVDYASSTSTVTNFTVTKATTTAAVGATQALVASDGTGNYTSVQSAVNSLPAAGGSVYIKPGTYTGDVTVVQPNVSLRGLGGNPSAVVLTHSGGAFGGSGVYAYAGEFTSAQNNGAQLPAGSSLFSGDEGSSTLVVAPGTNTAVGTSQLTPNGFYGENFTLANTYDTDPTTTTTTYVSGGVCSANAGAAQTYNYLFNNGLLCASQALAVWVTGDLAVFNNVYTTSLQDTIYAGSQGSGTNGYIPSRQYWFRGKVTGDVDYIFGDAAAVFDYSTIYSAIHGTSAGGTVTIEAQNKMRQTGSSTDYLSGYVMNNNVFTSQTTGMTNLYFGRPYGPYSTWIMLNSYVDQVTPAGYIEFSGDTNLPTSTYAEYNDILYTDPATNTADINGVLYTGTGGNTGSGVTGTREVTSQSPGTPMSANTVKTSMTQAQAQAYFPTNFLNATVSSAISPTTNWVPTDAIATGVNTFVPSGTTATVAPNSSVTILMRPQTPGLGAITNGSWTIPTGTYTLTDSFNGANTTLASGSLDASGEAYFTSASLTPGTHSLSWTYSGDSNFSGSTTTSAYTLVVSGYPTTTIVSANPGTIPYGSSSSVTVNVTSTAGTPTGSVTLSVDSAQSQTMPLTAGAATFTVSGLAPGNHTLIATYAGTTNFASSTSASIPLVVTTATPTVTVNAASIAYGATSTTLSATIAYAGAQAPTGAVTFTVNGSAAGVGTASCYGSASPLTCTTIYTAQGLAAGSYPVTATVAADANYATASNTATLTVTAVALTVAVASVTLPYGAASTTLTATVAYTGTAAPTGIATFVVNSSATGVGPTTCSGTSSPLTCTATYTAPTLAAGTYPIRFTINADTNYSVGSNTSTLTVTKLSPTVAVGSASLVYGATTASLTATVAYTGPAAPVGALTFTVNGSTTGVATVACTGTTSPITCKATYTIPATLNPGSYAITATLAADTNYNTASDTGTLLLTGAPDFTFSNTGVSYQSLLPGGSAIFSYSLSSTFGSYPGPVTFAVSGLPPGATYTITPTTVATTGGPQTVTLTIQTVKPATANATYRFGWETGSRLALATLLVPACFRRRKLPARLLTLLVFAGSLATLAGLTGCATGNGFNAQAPANYAVTVTATAGTVQHTSTITLNIQ